MEDQQQLSIAVDLYCLHSCRIFSGYISQTVFYADWDRRLYCSMDKNHYLYPVHLPGLPVTVVDLWFPFWTVRVLLGEGKETIQRNSKSLKIIVKHYKCRLHFRK